MARVLGKSLSSLIRVNVIDHATACAHQALQERVAALAVEVVAAQHPGHLRQRHILEIDASCCDRFQKGSLSSRRLLRVDANQQLYDEAGVKRPLDRMTCLRQRRWPPPSAPGSGSI